MTNQRFAVTFFKGFAATSKTELLCTVDDLASKIRNTSGPTKDALPWLKLGRFGDWRTERGSLRHDVNLLSISGVEADYDGERMEVDEARDILEKQGLAGIIYTSPSHTADTPRWRVVCPLGEELPPARRSHQLGRLNGLFRGIFAVESWTLSQSYYYGSVNRNPSHRVEVVDGTPIDTHDDLDMAWTGKPGGSSAAADLTAGLDAREDAELIRCIVTGEHLHVELVALAARYIGRGMPAATVVELLRGIMLAAGEGARDERWLDRTMIWNGPSPPRLRSIKQRPPNSDDQLRNLPSVDPGAQNP